MRSISSVFCGNDLSLRFARTANELKAQRLDFVPRRAANGVHVALHGTHHGVIRDAQHALHALDGCIDRSVRAQPNQEPVARLLDSLDRNSLQPASQRRKELAEEKSAIAAFQPQFVIVDDNDRFAHSKFSDFTRALNFSKLYQTAAQCVASGEPSRAFIVIWRPACTYILACLSGDNSKDTANIGTRLCTTPWGYYRHRSWPGAR